MPYIPAELVDNILGNLHPNAWEEQLNDEFRGKQNLHSCSLVSRSWSTVSRRHLFRDVIYSFKRLPDNPPPDFDTGDYEGRDPHPVYGVWLSSRVKPRTSLETVRYKTFPMFCTFIRKSPAIRQYIRRLRLDAWPSGSLDGYNDDNQISRDAFVQLLHDLPTLETLSLCNIILSTHLIDTSIPFPRLKKVFITENVDMGSDNEGCKRSWAKFPLNSHSYKDILACFTIVEFEQLRIHINGWDESREMPNDPPPCSMQAETLVVSDVGYRGTWDALQYFATSPHLGAVRSLSLGELALDEDDSIQLDMPNLEELRWKVVFGDGSDECRDNLTLIFHVLINSL